MSVSIRTDGKQRGGDKNNCCQDDRWEDDFDDQDTSRFNVYWSRLQSILRTRRFHVFGRRLLQVPHTAHSAFVLSSDQSINENTHRSLSR